MPLTFQTIVIVIIIIYCFGFMQYKSTKYNFDEACKTEKQF